MDHGWIEIGRCVAEERFQQAVLAADGKHCFLNDNDDEYVWDVHNSKQVWCADRNAETFIINERMIDIPFIEMTNEAFLGRFRMFGLWSDHPIMELGNYAVALGRPAILSENYGNLFICELNTETYKRYRFDDYSGDWAFATFSESGEVIAVLTPYVATFYGRHNHTP